MHVIYIDSKKTERVLEVEAGLSVMEAARRADIPEIEADCGGACCCATCHVHVDEKWLDKFPPMSKIENSLLSMQEDRDSRSRLSCQLIVSEGMEGLTVYTSEPSIEE